MNLDRFPYGNPDVEVLPGKQKYPFKLNKDFVYCFPGDGDFAAQDFVAPAGYQTDFFSIPQILWGILSPIGPGIHGAIIHDVLCSTEWGLPGESVAKRVTRANRVLRQAMIDSGCPKWRVNIIYLGVKLGCIYTWKTHRPAEVSDDLQLMLDATDRWYSAKSRRL